MSHPWIAFLLALCAAAPPVVPAQDRPTADDVQKRVSQLIENLGSDSYPVREQAQNKLVEIGEPAFEALKNAAVSNDPEVRLRAVAILRGFRKDGWSYEDWLKEHVVPASQDPQQDEARDIEVAKIISGWKVQVAKLKDDNDISAALSTLGATVHPKVLAVLNDYLRTGSDRVKKTAAGLMGAYKGDKTAADDLVKALGPESAKAKKGPAGAVMGAENAIAILEAIGKVGCRASAKKIAPYNRHMSVELSAAAVIAEGEIGSLYTVDELILLMLEFETTAAQFKMGIPAVAGPGPGPGPAALARAEFERRVNEVYPAIEPAIQKITGYAGPSMKAAGWSAWWFKNKSALKANEKAALMPGPGSK